MKGLGTPMSRGWVPYGKHATLVCWGLDPQGLTAPETGWMPLPVGARLWVPGDKGTKTGFLDSRA